MTQFWKGIFGKGNKQIIPKVIPINMGKHWSFSTSFKAKLHKIDLIFFFFGGGGGRGGVGPILELY